MLAVDDRAEGQVRSSFRVVSAERAFRVMGTDAHVLVWQSPDPFVEPEELLDLAESELYRLEALWSRFVPDSDVCRMNEADGVAVPVAVETIEVLALADRARKVSGGLFDHLLLAELEAAGYARSFDELDRSVPVVVEPPTAGRNGETVAIDRDGGRAASPPGRAVDLGGIGKGRAADIVASRLLQEGALGACVNLGGDLRVVGEVGHHDPTIDGIVVAVEDPFEPAQDLAFVSVRNAAVATSSRTRRRWPTANGENHHLLDPSTGRPARTGLAAVTVIAPSAAWAEVIAKAAFLAGSDEEPACVRGVPRLLVADDGSMTRRDGFEEFER